MASAATGLLWLRNGRNGEQPAASPAPLSEKMLVKEIRRAWNGNDAIGTKNALLSWAGHHWPGSQVRRLGDFAARQRRQASKRGKSEPELEPLYL